MTHVEAMVMNKDKTVKILKVMFTSAVWLQVLIIVGLLAVMIYSMPSCKKRELFRVTSPDNITDAVLIEEACHITTEPRVSLYFVPLGSTYMPSQAVMYEDAVDVITAEWISIDKFHLKYESQEFSYQLTVENRR
jgi:hypothetical protein